MLLVGTARCAVRTPQRGVPTFKLYHYPLNKCIFMIRTKSVFSSIEPGKDGWRILATRFRGRGMPTSRYHVWMANLGPSEKLLRAVLSGKIGWDEFGRNYRKELFESGTIDRKNHTIKNHGQKFTLRLLQQLARRGPVTLLCHCDEAESRCHRHILGKILEGKI